MPTPVLRRQERIGYKFLTRQAFGTVYYGRVKRAAILLLLFTLSVSCGYPAAAQAPPAVPFAPESLRTWLTAISSDEFEGRATFSPGLDKAAAYIADRLKEAALRNQVALTVHCQG